MNIRPICFVFVFVFVPEVLPKILSILLNFVEIGNNTDVDFLF